MESTEVAPPVQQEEVGVISNLPSTGEEAEHEPDENIAPGNVDEVAIEAPEVKPEEKPAPLTKTKSTSSVFAQRANTVNRSDYFKKPEFSLPVETELSNARKFLLQNSEKSDSNLYDHLSTVLMRVLEQRPNNAVDIFENISAEVKRSKFQPEQFDLGMKFRNASNHVKALELAKIQSSLLSGARNDEKSTPPQVEVGEIPDIMDLANLFEWAGVSFGKEETFLMLLSLNKLVEEKSLKSVRLWGKILGTKADYYVVEAEMKEGMRDESQLESGNEPSETHGDQEEKEQGSDESMNEDPESAAAKASQKQLPEIGAEEEDGNVQNWFDPGTVVPRPKHKPTPAVPVESGSGVNKYIYYVCNYPGGPWKCLPDAIPEKLQTSRKIRKYFTGDLSTKIISYPPFNGSEAQYLRCQIARISAATVISPAGYYAFDSEEGESDEAEANATIIVNPDFEGLPNDALTQLSNWVHHVPYILPQGRVAWTNPWEGVEMGEGEDDEQSGDDEGNDEGDTTGATGGGSGEGGGEPESGPTILSSVSSDAEHGGNQSWAVRICSPLSPLKYSPITLRSLSWPGATVVAYMDKFANVYVGDGLKDLAGNPFVSAKLPAIQSEYGTGEPAPGTVADFTEEVDPTVEEENAFEEAKVRAEGEKSEGESGQEDEDAEEAGSEEED